MSGYVDVKLSTASARGLTAWKTWKKQWCTLRPNSVKNGIIVVFHATAGVSSASQVEIPKGSVVCRSVSKTKSHAFGIYPSVNSQRSLILLAGQTESDSQSWMSKIRAMLDGRERADNMHTENHFNVSIIDNEFSNAHGFKGLYGAAKVNSNNFEIFDPSDGQTKSVFRFCDINDIDLIYNADKSADFQRIFVVKTNSNFKYGQGQFSFFSLSAKALTNKLRNNLLHLSPEIVFRKLDRRKSRSEGTLSKMTDYKKYVSKENERDSGLSSCDPMSSKSNSRWYSSDIDPSLRLSINDDGVVLKGKVASSLISAGILLSAHKHKKGSNKIVKSCNKSPSKFDNTSDFSESSFNRRSSSISMTSGVYEEISEPIHGRRKSQSSKLHNTSSENMYEVLIESIYGTARRQSKKVVPPPLPPRRRFHSGRFESTSDSGVEEEGLFSINNPEANESNCSSIHGSVGSLSSLPQNLCHETQSTKSDSRGYGRLNAVFDAFRKRVQSDVRHNKSEIACKCDTISNKSAGSSSIFLKKRFDFNVTPSKSINMFRNLKITRALRKLGRTGNFSEVKNSAKSCETLDAHSINDDLPNNRCSKSEENLDLTSENISIDEDVQNLDTDLSMKWYGDKSDENVKDLSIICTENSLKSAYPEDILELILKGKTKLVEQKLKKRAAEEEYILMSPNGTHVNPIVPRDRPEVFTSTTPLSPIEGNYMVMKGI